MRNNHYLTTFRRQGIFLHARTLGPRLPEPHKPVGSTEKAWVSHRNRTAFFLCANRNNQYISTACTKKKNECLLKRAGVAPIVEQKQGKPATNNSVQELTSEPKANTKVWSPPTRPSFMRLHSRYKPVSVTSALPAPSGNVCQVSPPDSPPRRCPSRKRLYMVHFLRSVTCRGSAQTEQYRGILRLKAQPQALRL
jgi:hypothetical protein